MIEGLKTALLAGAIIGAFLFGRYDVHREYDIKRLTAERDQAVLIKYQYAQAVKAQGELTEELAKAKAKVRVVREQVKVYVEPDKDLLCGPSTGVISMFNAARRPDLPTDSPATVEEGRTPSGYSSSDFNDQNLDVIERYNALMIEHNKLVDLLTGETPAK